MPNIRNILMRAALAAGVAGAVLAATAGPAEARIVCNRYHCWHVHRHYYDGYYGSGLTLGFGLAAAVTGMAAMVAVATVVVMAVEATAAAATVAAAMAVAVMVAAVTTTEKRTGRTFGSALFLCGAWNGTPRDAARFLFREERRRLR